jgi:queuosine precursor transporter
MNAPTIKSPNHKKNNLLLLLFGIFLTNAILAELIGVKIFSFEAALGMPPANIKLLDNLFLDFNLTAGVIIWPVVFVTTDVINEYFGKKAVKKISLLAAGLIAFSFLVISAVNYLPPAKFWLDVNNVDPSGNPFDINFAFAKVYQQGMGIIIGSLVAFVIGQLLDATIFQYLRRLTGNKQVWLRATGSTLVSQLLDSFLVLGIAFYIFGDWSLNQVISVGIINYTYKFLMAIFLTPVIYLAHFVIDFYLGTTVSHDMINEATGLVNNSPSTDELHHHIH